MTTAEHRAEPLLAVEDLHVEFETPRGVLHAVDGVSFSVDHGQTLGIVGESGSGKSVIARTIMNILAANGTPSGSIRFNGRELVGLPKKEGRHLYGVDIAMVFQDPMTSLNPVKRVGAQLTESLRFHLGHSKRKADEIALELLRQVEIPSAESRLRVYPHELSGGMRQRVVIAMALACQPKLLIADEPTTALDVTVQKNILDLLDTLRRERDMGLILITHDLGVARGRCDHITVMYAGQVMEQADSAQLFSDMRHPYAEALLDSIPNVDQPSHTRLRPIPGRPPDLVSPPPGCRFAARCRYAQDRCLAEVPELTGAGWAEHRFRCFFPVGTDAGRQALDANSAAGRTAAGLDLDPDQLVVS